MMAVQRANEVIRGTRRTNEVIYIEYNIIV